MLDRGAEHPLTILAASAGAGKTAALSAWASARTAPVAWLSLDAPDGDRRTFWSLVLAALRRAGGADPVPALEVHPSESVDIFIPELINALERHDQPITIVLDDLQRTSSREVYADLDRLLRHPLSNLRLVVATRFDPPIGVERLRLAGHVVELRARDLAFSLEETAQLLDLLGIDLADEDVELLWRRAEGWPAGLRLAATTLAERANPGRFVAELAGDDANIAEYLLAEVLAGEHPETREFLIRASVVDELPVDLVAELTGRRDSWPLLDELTHRHAFLAPVGERRGVYRMHTLFAELLRAQLRYERPEEVAGLHDRAARWYERNGAPLAALRHAVQSGDDELAAELARACWVQALASGEFTVLRSLVAQVGTRHLDRDPEYALAFAASLIESQHDPRVDHYLRIADERASGLSGDRRRQFDVARAAVTLYRGRFRGDLPMANEAAEQLLEWAEDSVALKSHEAIRALALSTLGIVEVWHGELGAGIPRLERARAVATDAELDWIRLLCDSYLALASMLCGRLAAGERRAHSALAMAAERGWSRSGPAAVALSVLANTQFHWNLIDEADATLDRAENALAGSREPPLVALHRLTRGRVRKTQGRMGEALEEFGRGIEKLADWPNSADVRSILETEAGIARAALGDRELAERDLRRAATENPGPAIGLASLALSAGDPESALVHLGATMARGDRLIVSQRVEGWALTAVAQDALADHDAASASLEHALETAEPGGFRQALLAQGVALRPVLRRQLRLGTSHRAFVEELLVALEDSGGRAPPARASRAADRPRGGRAAVPPDDDVQPRDRRRALCIRQHGQDAPSVDLPEARGGRSPRGGGPGTRAAAVGTGACAPVS